MKKIGFVLGLALLAAGLLNGQNINSEKSVVNFKIRNMKIRTVTGIFTGMKGEVRFDPDDPAVSYFKVSIDAASVNTESRRRDDHLRNEDFFHVEKYPLISFESTSIQPDSAGFTTTGVLFMRGVSKEVSIPFAYNNNRFTGTLDINRFEYKIGEGTGRAAVDEIASLEIVAVVN